jgi:hypothetical protein
MARRFIGKGKLSSDGKTRKLLVHIQDADNRFREEPFEDVPEAEFEARVRQLLAGGQFDGRWPDPQDHKPLN